VTTAGSASPTCIRQRRSARWRSRLAFVRQASDGDSDLRREVELLLAQDEKTLVIDRPIAAAAHSLLADNAGVQPGSFVGPYRIDSLLGVGGMGEVYRARDSKLNRDVAIKILPSAFATDLDRLARFKREAQVLASLNHPNIAAIYGFDDSGAVHALVLELVEGPTLADRIARGPLPIDEALKIAKQIAEALEAAHEQGIIHRDLKPANIKVRDDDTVKVLDFGLAKAIETAGSMSASVSMSPTITSPAMTQAGIILGTAAYMSPEQARGKPVDRRADIWAFGCVVFEMLTGRRAFEAEDVSLTLAEVMKSDPEWSDLPPSVSPSLKTVLRRCLAKDPRQRIRDVGDIRLALDGAFDTTSERVADAAPITVSPPFWRRAIPAALSAIVAAVLTAAAVWVTRPSPPVAITRFTYPLPEGQVFQNTGRQALDISPDGAQILYAASLKLFVRSLSELEPRTVINIIAGEGTNAVFSPDGRSIVFRSGADQTLKRVNISGGTPVTLCPAAAPTGISWTPEGILFGQGAKGILRVSSNGGTPEQVVRVEPDEVADGPQMLPGGNAVMFTLAKGGVSDRWDKARIVVQMLKSGERKTLIDGGSNARYLSTGQLLYATSGTVFAVPFDLKRLAVTGGPVPVIEGVLRSGTNGPTGVAHFSVSNTGTLVYIPGPVSASVDSTLSMIDRKGNVEILKLPPAPYEHPRVSRDGNRLVYTLDDGQEANIYTYDLSRSSAPRRLTFSGKNRFPIWSADGQRVAFQSDREGDAGIFWQRGDGTDQAIRLTKPDAGTSHAPETWSPDGERFLFRVTKDSSAFTATNDSSASVGSVSLWMFSMKDKTSVRFDDVESGTPPDSVFSPDGRWVAYSVTSTTNGATGIFVQPFPPTGTRHEISERAGIHPLWSVDGKELLYSGANLAVGVTTQPTFAVGNPVPWPRSGLSSPGPSVPRRWDMMPDGRVLGVTVGGLGASTLQEVRVVLNWQEELKQRVPTK
jgi:serine/threonine protein kinase/Tol biopolymer transport system component